jgi:peptide chain release factor 1
MLEKLAEIEARYQELNLLMAEHSNDIPQLTAFAKEQASLKGVVLLFNDLLRVDREIRGAEELLAEEDEDELLEMARLEIQQLESEKESLLERTRAALVPKDPNDDRNVIMEIRAGTGGDEAGLFAADLFRMYNLFAEKQGWKTEFLSSSPTGIGGLKEIIFLVKGQGAYSRLKFEGGVHRVQRVPVTETSGRIHTSTATVAILPEAQEIDVSINPEDLSIDVYRASGHGGQSVNTTDSAVRITHLPTGLVVTCQDERSQQQNRMRALAVLRARLLELEQRKQREEETAMRRSLVGTGERSEKIRTYNFPQNRLTDHRISLTVYNLDQLMDGNVEGIVDALTTTYESERLAAAGSKS